MKSGVSTIDSPTGVDGDPMTNSALSNFITAEVTAAAASAVRSGQTVSCARPLPTQPGPDNPMPVVHHMIGTATEGYGADYFAVASHGYSTSHLDALCHIFHEGTLYNGYEAETVTAHGAAQLGIHHLRSGIITRGVLVDVPAIRGVEALEPGEPIFPEDLESAERTTGLTIQTGDALLVRTGRWRWRESHGPSSPSDGLAGLDASCLTWLHGREVAVLGSDGVSRRHPVTCRRCSHADPLRGHRGDGRPSSGQSRSRRSLRGVHRRRTLELHACGCTARAPPGHSVAGESDRHLLTDPFRSVRTCCTW